MIESGTVFDNFMQLRWGMDVNIDVIHEVINITFHKKTTNTIL